MLKVTRHNTAAGDVSWPEHDTSDSRACIAAYVQLGVADLNWALEHSGQAGTPYFTVEHVNAGKRDSRETDDLDPNHPDNEPFTRRSFKADEGAPHNLEVQLHAEAVREAVANDESEPISFSVPVGEDHEALQSLIDAFSCLDERNRQVELLVVRALAVDC